MSVHVSFCDPRPGDDERWCCYGAAIHGACTCWEVRLDREPEPPADGPSDMRRRLCKSCAYRPDSIERSTSDVQDHDADDLEMLAWSDTPFYCHAGMPRILREEHPDGSVIHRDGEGYMPITRPDGAPCKADGTPADICSGWWARRQQVLRELDAESD